MQPASALPEAGDLTLGAYAGQVLVGLTVRPGEPGTNQVLVYLLPLAGEAAAADIPVELSVGEHRLDVAVCGATCRSAEADLLGGERLEVRIAAAAQGGTAIFTLPPLPAPDARDLLEQMRAGMINLRTFRMGEVLRPPEPPILSTYAFQAPDRMQLDVSTGFQTIWVGNTLYTRSSPSTRWQVEQLSFSPTVPSFVWDPSPSQVDGARFVAPHIVGVESIQGISTRVLSFFMQRSTIPIWFRLWIDAGGLVRQAEMRADGHFMDHRYYDFDTALVIEPPPDR